MLPQCWATVYDAGSILKQRRVNISYLLVLIPLKQHFQGPITNMK